MLPLRKILCPIDFSDFSRHAMNQAGELAAQFDAELCLLHVTQPIQPISGLSPFPQSVTYDAPALEKSVREGADEQLRELIERHPLPNVRVRPLVQHGYAADEIVSVAAQEDAGLIVLATHGLTGWRQALFGSVTERVLRLASCPVLIARAEEPGGASLLPLRKLVCSTDFSEPSYAALDVASEWAAYFNAELCVVHVVEPQEQPGFVLEKWQIEEAMQSEAVQQLNQVVEERLPQAAGLRPVVGVGRAADEIAAIAEEGEADLIVIATQGAGGWRAFLSGTAVERLLFGSVTTSVMKLVSCPILTVRMAAHGPKNSVEQQ